jgi:3-phenylpropionate/trans-cinnamate dioxygenase ferredoxin subunit
MTRHVVAKVGDVPDGGKLRVSAGKRAFCLVNLGGEYFALADRCPHESGSLAAGRISGVVTSDGPGDYRLCRRGEMVKCPWHGWEFDIRTGQSWSDPTATRARPFAAEAIAGEELVRGPYVAETFPVEVDGTYIIVDC